MPLDPAYKAGLARHETGHTVITTAFSHHPHRGIKMNKIMKINFTLIGVLVIYACLLLSTNFFVIIAALHRL